MAHILVVDDDETTLSLIAQALARPQRTIHMAAHGQEALERIAEAMPDLVITDVVMPRMNGWALLRKLRTTHATAFVPIILMTSLDSEHDRIRGFRLGADDFVSKPVSFEELELRVENVLHHAHMHGKSALLGASLTGSLAQFGLATLLTVLEIERKTGVMRVEHAEGQAMLAFRDGRVVGGMMEEQPSLHGEDCVFELLTWATGSFAFAEQAVEIKDQVGMNTSALLLDCARRMDELVPVEIDD